MARYLLFLFLLFTSCLIQEKNVYKEAESLFYSSRYKEASMLFDSIEHVEKFSPAIYYYKGVSCYFDTNYVEAIKNLKLAFYEGFEMERTTFFLGESYYNLGKLDSAEFFYFMALGRDIRNDLYNYRLALVFFEREDYETSLSLVSRAMELNASDSRYYYLKSKIYFNLKQYKLSIDYINKVLSYDITYEYLKSRSLTYFVDGQFENSITDARELVKLDSLDPTGYYIMAMNQQMLMDNDSACFYAYESLRIDSSFQLSKEFITDFCIH